MEFFEGGIYIHDWIHQPPNLLDLLEIRSYLMSVSDFDWDSSSRPIHPLCLLLSIAVTTLSSHFQTNYLEEKMNFYHNQKHYIYYSRPSFLLHLPFSLHLQVKYEKDFFLDFSSLFPKALRIKSMQTWQVNLPVKYSSTNSEWIWITQISHEIQKTEITLKCPVQSTI